MIAAAAGACIASRPAHGKHSTTGRHQPNGATWPTTTKSPSIIRRTRDHRAPSPCSKSSARRTSCMCSNMKAGEQRRAAYLAINPMGKVPALRHGDALITEQVAIFLTLPIVPRGAACPAGRRPAARPLLCAGWCFTPPASSPRSSTASRSATRRRRPMSPIWRLLDDAADTLTASWRRALIFSASAFPPPSAVGRQPRPGRSMFEARSRASGHQGYIKPRARAAGGRPGPGRRTQDPAACASAQKLPYHPAR